jgi:pyruvate formate lyase activating enzyme
MNTEDVVFNIQRFSLHDGPGIRTTVFLKGCSMQCFWCHNPEGQHPEPELRFFPDRCIACGECVKACPSHAHELRDGVHIFFRERCTLNGRCVETCYPHALQMEGRTMTVGQVMVEVLADLVFYKTSGGGVTLSGGEPALSKEFAREILEQCKLNGIHTAIETCGECPWTALEALLPVTDLIMMDIKHLTREKHQAATGQSNERILENARRLALSGKPIIFRTPIVPTVNDSREEIGQIALFVHDLIELRQKNNPPGNHPADITYELLAFHKLASDKYPSLGLEYKAAAINPPTKEQMATLAEEVKRCGLAVTVR